MPWSESTLLKWKYATEVKVRYDVFILCYNSKCNQLMSHEQRYGKRLTKRLVLTPFHKNIFIQKQKMLFIIIIIIIIIIRIRMPVNSLHLRSYNNFAMWQKLEFTRNKASYICVTCIQNFCSKLYLLLAKFNVHFFLTTSYNLLSFSQPHFSIFLPHPCVDRKFLSVAFLFIITERNFFFFL